jgi:MFS family permease
MSSLLFLLRHERRARVFLVAQGQSSLGTGAGYVALALVAYARFHSPWALTLILLADYAPGALLGPVLGALADRWPRRRCLVIAEVGRGAAFLAIAFVHSFPATVALALVAGAGNALFDPAAMASLPSLVSSRHLPAATSVFGALQEAGYTVGPLLAAPLLIVLAPQALLVANGVSFVLSAVVVGCLSFGSSPRPHGSRRSLLAETRAGIALVTARGPIRALLLSSTAFVVCLGMVNVGELLLARSFGASDSQFALLVATMAVGIVVGLLLGVGGGAPSALKARYLLGLAICGVALVLSGSVPTFAMALPAFAAVGVGNGIGLGNQRLLLQTVVPADQLGRAFGMSKSLASWAMALSFFAGGAAASLLGARWLFILAGAGALVAWSLASGALRGHWAGEPVGVPALAGGEAR